MCKVSQIRWASIEKIAEETGLSVEAIRAYKKKGQIQHKIHWIKAANKRIMIDRVNFEKWLGRPTELA